MDSELIMLMAMCNTQEIQDKWEPKKGDKFIAEYALWTIGDATFRYTGKHDEVPVKDKYPVPTQVCPEGWGCKEGMIFIPSIEDLLEWLGDSINSIKQYKGRWIVMTHLGYIADTLIEALLRAYMHPNHSKQWDGNAWI